MSEGNTTPFVQYVTCVSSLLTITLSLLLQVQVTDQPLTSLRVMESGRIAAVGSADGSTTIVQFSDGLVDIQPNEKQALTSVSPLLQMKSFPA